jgi:hypothetical protein
LSDHDLPTLDQDPRKAAVLNGAAVVMRSFLHVMREYTCGPSSSLPAERVLGVQLVEIGQALERFGQAVHDGQVGQVGERKRNR